MKKLITLLVVFVALTLLVVFFAPKLQESSISDLEFASTLTSSTVESDTALQEEIEAFEVHLAFLDDVSGGNSLGEVEAYFMDDTYYLKALFSNLPVPEAGYFYEGWIVRKGENLSVISTGVAEAGTDGSYSNIFVDKMDLLDHDFYVLTLEPNDGDPAPAVHILEGVFKSD